MTSTHPDHPLSVANPGYLVLPVPGHCCELRERGERVRLQRTPEVTHLIRILGRSIKANRPRGSICTPHHTSCSFAYLMDLCQPNPWRKSWRTSRLILKITGQVPIIFRLLGHYKPIPTMSQSYLYHRRLSTF